MFHGRRKKTVTYLKRFSCVGMIAAILMTGNVQVYAWEIRDVFDADYYASNNGDLKGAFGTNEKALYQHFLRYGMSEGRKSTSVFDVEAYRRRYPDLEQAFGDDLEQYYYHYVTYGIAEGRYGGGEFNADLYVSMNREYYLQNGLSDTFTFFDWKKYRDSYADLREAFGDNAQAYLEHYLNYGIKEGRNPGGTFDPVKYLREHPENFYDAVTVYQQFVNKQKEESAWKNIVNAQKETDAAVQENVTDTKPVEKPVQEEPVEVELTEEQKYQKEYEERLAWVYQYEAEHTIPVESITTVPLTKQMYDMFQGEVTRAGTNAGVGSDYTFREAPTDDPEKIENVRVNAEACLYYENRAWIFYYIFEQQAIEEGVPILTKIPWFTGGHTIEDFTRSFTRYRVVAYQYLEACEQYAAENEGA